MQQKSETLSNKFSSWRWNPDFSWISTSLMSSYTVRKWLFQEYNSITGPNIAWLSNSIMQSATQMMSCLFLRKWMLNVSTAKIQCIFRNHQKSFPSIIKLTLHIPNANAELPHRCPLKNKKKTLKHFALSLEFKKKSKFNHKSFCFYKKHFCFCFYKKTQSYLNK